jgi:secondary thiamine-phosphate synthase enzyme
MQKIVNLTTFERENLYDITDKIADFVREADIKSGLLNIYALGSTVAIMVQEKSDGSVKEDMLHLLRKLIPQGTWEHDKTDNNGDAHLKSGLVGPSQTIPIIDGKLGLSQWQNIFFCEFDGPRLNREIVLTFIKIS